MQEKRPPIVTVLGHVDHGKTTLLDVIRKTRVAAREAGGITQGIGASKIKFKNSEITFIDTPGHEAFSSMRQRGVRLADIAILVVASDDGPMPQTLEALKYIQESQTPMIVAFTKSDLPSANFERAQGQMEQNSVFFEGRGGDTPFVQVSAKNNIGIDELLEMISLVSEVNELTDIKTDEFESFVIETNKDNRGLVVSVVIRTGTLSQGDTIYDGKVAIKVRGLIGEDGKTVKTAMPGDPVLILGFDQLPEVGAILKKSSFDSEIKKEDANVEVEKGELGIVLKVKSAGSLDAIKVSLPSRAKVLMSGVGDVTESDIFFAKAAGASVYVFESKLPNRVKSLSETEGVKVQVFDIIYKLIEEVESEIDGQTVKYSGNLEILAKFPYNRLLVAGCKVTSGQISKSDKLVLVRREKELGHVKIKDLRRGKTELDLARAGEECGVLFVPQLDFEVGDSLLVLKK